MSEIWIADWTFYSRGIPFVVNTVVTKKLPLPLLMANRDSYNRVIKDLETRLGLRFVEALDKEKSGLKKFKIEYVRKIGF